MSGNSPVKAKIRAPGVIFFLSSFLTGGVYYIRLLT